MKIAVFHELPLGGGRRAVNEYARHLKEVNIIDLYSTDEKKEKTEADFFHHRYVYPLKTKTWRGKNWRIRLYKDTIELIKLFLLHRTIAKDIDKRKYDAVFVSASKYIEAPFIMKFLKTPFIFFCSDPYYRIIYDDIFAVSKDLDFFRYYYEKLNRFIRKILDWQNVHAAKYCYSPSRFIAQRFAKTYKKKNAVIYYGIDSKFFSPGKQKKDIDIFYIGSYDPVDGLDLLEGALKYMKHKPTVRKLLSEEEWISDDKQLLDLYRRSKILFCPARNEGLGASPMEGMSCGLTVVAVDEAGHKETILDGKTGFLVPRNPKKVAEKLDFLLSHPKEMAVIGQQARENMVNNWSWKKRAKELEEVLKGLKNEKEMLG